MGVKIAVVGAGSTYTPELVEGFASRADRLAVDQLTLLDVDPERLEIVGGLAGRILARRGYTGGLTLTMSRDDARLRRRNERDAFYIGDRGGRRHRAGARPNRQDHRRLTICIRRRGRSNASVGCRPAHSCAAHRSSYIVRDSHDERRGQRCADTCLLRVA